MNPTDLVQDIMAPRAADPGMYPTAYAIDFVLAYPREFARATGIAVKPLYPHTSSQRQAALEALDAYAEQSNLSRDEVYTTLANAHMLNARLYLPAERLVLASARRTVI